MRRRKMATRWPLIFLLVFCPVVFCETTKLPNIVTILVDDLGWNDVGYHGSDQIKTPNIDALAYSGMILQRHYVLPTCTPSRAALLTGAFPIRSGMQGYPLRGGENRNLPLSFKLKPEWLKQLGYRTHLVGKWHLGYETNNHVPHRRGFDSFFGYYNGYIDYFNHTYEQRVLGWNKGDNYHGYDLHLNDNILWNEKGKYVTRELTKYTRNVIRAHNTEEPLYLYLAHLATHTGNEEVLGMQVPKDADVNGTYSHIKHYGRRLLAGCLEELDNSIGVVMEELHRKKMLDNSIIIVMSDNGAQPVSVDMSPNWGSNWPFAGSKFTLFEGGVRGAALIWSPLLPKSLINYGFMHITDWLPTLYSAAGGNVKDLGKIDGVDQWEALKKGTTVDRDHLLLNIDERAGIEGILLDNRYKLVKGGFSAYANFELHWGYEENLSPNPKYNPNTIMESPAGKIIRTVPEFKGLLTPEKMLELRQKATVKCEAPIPDIEHVNGFIDKSSEHRCPDFCVFDILEDPCELHEIEKQSIVHSGVILLNKYKQNLMTQKDTIVDPMSNPENWGGAWMPWKFDECPKSVARDLVSQFLYVALFFVMTWYSLSSFRRFRHHQS